MIFSYFYILVLFPQITFKIISPVFVGHCVTHIFLVDYPYMCDIDSNDFAVLFCASAVIGLNFF